MVILVFFFSGVKEINCWARAAFIQDHANHYGFSCRGPQAAVYFPSIPFSVPMAMVEWAKAPPALSAAATKMASAISFAVAPAF